SRAAFVQDRRFIRHPSITCLPTFHCSRAGRDDLPQSHGVERARAENISARGARNGMIEACCAASTHGEDRPVSSFTIRPVERTDRNWIAHFLDKHWGSTR